MGHVAAVDHPHLGFLSFLIEANIVDDGLFFFKHRHRLNSFLDRFLYALRLWRLPESHMKDLFRLVGEPDLSLSLSARSDHSEPELSRPQSDRTEQSGTISRMTKLPGVPIALNQK
jgi:hypothetical protein